MDRNKLTMTLEEVAAVLGKAPRSVSQDLKRNPESVPPCRLVPGGRRLLWLRKDVERWLEALPTMGGPIRDPEWAKYLDAA